ncbi:MAG: class I SAM-dependent methyltransferase [Nanoarchaeota archaeon]|nr:class I SAM-dependent methyltransferase [Nanoarchaeota archaeon]MBU1104127.1 class I SAM-dependent methyltransferase [Nanoarchaeota archaeon]
MNDYDVLSEDYNKVHEKPDLKYSLSPAFLKIAGDLDGKTVIDVGCGDGFFTRQFAKKAKKVIGIDNSSEQIAKAKTHATENLEYFLADMINYDYPKSDLLSAPFVLNYFETQPDLAAFLKKLYASLNKRGSIISIVDMPSSEFHDFKKYGSVKKLSRGLVEGSGLTIDLYDKQELLVTLHSFYHTKETFEAALTEAGFKEIKWHKPIVSDEGIEKFGEDYWSEYLANCDVAYFTAIK